MYINDMGEAKLASAIANKYIRDGGFSPEDFLKAYTTNTIGLVAPHAPTQKRTDAERAIVKTIRVRRANFRK